ncbi:MAG: glycosyltransferase [Bacteroides sp.]|jgi:glycosyltransferase involved in cell wall biosynthesis|nr:glycosyltransferase [Bacteroides sp.]
MKEMQSVVSVIIPVYNAIATLPDCIDSLLTQTYQHLELIFVDDCSTDGGGVMINHYLRKHLLATIPLTIKLLQHTTNRGVAAARNTGLEHATGEYIYYVDADDWVDPNALECLVNEAKQTDADIVGHEWYLSFNKKERRMRQPGFSNSREALMLMMSGVMRWNLWLFLVRRSLYQVNQIRFIEGIDMGEDLMVMIKLFVYANKVTILHIPFYHYGQSNLTSLTKICSEERLQQVTASVLEVERTLSSPNWADMLSPYLYFLKLNIKLPLLITNDVLLYKRWVDWFPESNAYVMCNKHLPWRTRLLQWMAVKRYFILVKLYYQCVIKVVYGIFYK